ncbi:hypothetical protein A3A75_00805 [Candidatus Woesebacteria bacterium RIFCSPLOWO2_01_FULL_39_10]|uniref:Uncharacterized protein n=1 Tax=Candidatus Woesebacteria bacterium RIFCSPLOWO2_01_FULL_39_10 TaxID=1802516 RepID=A0A1F8B3A5_9BACT|nr:MAG: hypothetical protein A3A75_00805 [Candidatus Woesebacteria bacterium RIFCSPLOWO2_01_FULL_39_10]
MSKNSQLLVDLGQGLSMMIGLPRIASWDNQSRPKKPKKGMFGFNLKSNSLEFFNGSYWLEAPLSEN